MTPDSTIPNKLDSQSFNRYTYVNNRPLTLTDPTGLGDTPLDQNPPQNSDWANPDSNPDMSCEGAGCGTTVLTGTGVDQNGQTVKIVVIINNFNQVAHLTVAGCIANCEGSTGTSDNGTTKGAAPSDQSASAASTSAKNADTAIVVTSRYALPSDRNAASKDPAGYDASNAKLAEDRVKADFAAHPEDEPDDMKGKDWHVEYSDKDGKNFVRAMHLPLFNAYVDEHGRVIYMSMAGIQGGVITLYLGSSHTPFYALMTLLHEFGHHSAAAVALEIAILNGAPQVRDAHGAPIIDLSLLNTDEVEKAADAYANKVYHDHMSAF